MRASLFTVLAAAAWAGARTDDKPEPPASPPSGKAAAPAGAGAGTLSPKLKALASRLSGPDPKARLAAAAALGEAGPEAAPAARDLCAALLDPAADVARAALVALERVDPALYELLVVVRVDSEEASRLDAVRKLGALREKGRPAAGFLAECLKRAAAGKECPTRAGLPPAAPGPIPPFPGGPGTASDAAQRAHVGAVMSALAELGLDDPESFDAMRTLAGRADEKDPYARANALDHLVAWAGRDRKRRERVAPAVVAAVGDPECRSTCLRAAAEYGPLCKKMLPAARELKLNPTAAVRKEARKAVAAMEAAD